MQQTQESPELRGQQQVHIRGLLPRASREAWRDPEQSQVQTTVRFRAAPVSRYYNHHHHLQITQMLREVKWMSTIVHSEPELE